MTKAQPGIHQLPRGCLLAVIVVASSLALAGCAPAPVVDQALFQRPMNLRGECDGPDGQPVPDTVTMDTYIVQTYDVAPTFARARSTDANSTDCQTCIGTGQCVIEHPRVCTCSSSVTAIPDNLSTEMANTTIPSLDTNDVYCFRVLAVGNGTVGNPPAAPCTCNLAWEDPTWLMAHARLCALSAPAAIGPLDIRMDLKCPGDRSGSGQNSNSSPFMDCVFPPMM